jgi:hypothetical protein
MTGWYFRANSVTAPGVFVGRSREDIRATTDADEMYAGALVYASLTMAYYTTEKAGAGLKFYLNAVMKVGDGNRLSQTRDEASEFGAMPLQFGTFQPSPTPPGAAAFVDSHSFAAQYPGYQYPQPHQQQPQAAPGWPQMPQAAPGWPQEQPQAAPGWPQVQPSQQQYPPQYQHYGAGNHPF